MKKLKTSLIITTYNWPEALLLVLKSVEEQSIRPDEVVIADDGEELLELLDLVVRFCLTHVHPYPLMPPSSVTLDGLSTDDLLAKMQEAYQKVLNSNIRLN